MSSTSQYGRTMGSSVSRKRPRTPTLPPSGSVAVRAPPRSGSAEPKVTPCAGLVGSTHSIDVRGDDLQVMNLHSNPRLCCRPNAEVKLQPRGAGATDAAGELRAFVSFNHSLDARRRERPTNRFRRGRRIAARYARASLLGSPPSRPFPCFGPDLRPDFSGDFHHAGCEIKQERRSTGSHPRQSDHESQGGAAAGVRRSTACRDRARRGAGRSDTHRSGQVR
jgi:hypothetical protein